MKYLKLFESFRDIDSICEELGIRNYTINPDGTVDVDGNVNLSYNGLTELPLKFGVVSGFFCCPNNELKTLKGGPKEVGGDFDCSDNELTSLEGGPKEVGGDFDCVRNQLTTLEGAPNRVGGDFSCFENELTSLEGAPKEVGGDFSCSRNKLTTLEGGPMEVGGIFDCEKNPIWNIYKLYPDYDTFIDSMEVYNYLRGTNIVRGRFSEAMEDINRDMPESIPGYKYI